MKKIILLLVLATLLLTACGKKEAPVEEIQPAEEQTVEVEKIASMNFIVQGEGETAKKLIEAAAMTVKGVTEVNWNMDKKTIKVTGSGDLVWEDVHSAIANAGFDTIEMKASDEAYEALPEEAKYRKPIRKATLRDSNNQGNQGNQDNTNRIKAKRQKAE